MHLSKNGLKVYFFSYLVNQDIKFNIMKRLNSYLYFKLQLLIGVIVILSTSCEKNLEPVVYDKFSNSTFFKTTEDAEAAVTATYRGIQLYHTASNSGDSYFIQSHLSTGELITNYVGGGIPYTNCDYREDDQQLYQFYLLGMPIVTEVTIDIDKISQMKIEDNLKNRLIAELTAIRAYVSHMLYNIYGPVPIRIDPKVAGDPSSTAIPRPTSEWMVAQIEKDYEDAAAVLPTSYSGSDYGRITKGACLTGLMKLYIKEKRWADAITIGEQIKSLGYQLIPNYGDNFSYKSKEGNSELILVIPARVDCNSNGWLERTMPPSYIDPTGAFLPMDGYNCMPWPTYDKFDQNDKRLERLLAKWPTIGGAILDGRASGYAGAIPMKYAPDPTTITKQQGVDEVIWRYADVMLLLAEAINETQGPTDEAYSLINAVRNRAGLNGYSLGTLDKDQFRSKIMDERLFELWCEDGIRKEDMIRWGTWIQFVKDNGSTVVKPEFILYPLPRSVISQSNGLIVQNPGY